MIQESSACPRANALATHAGTCGFLDKTGKYSGLPDVSALRGELPARGRTRQTIPNTRTCGMRSQKLWRGH